MSNVAPLHTQEQKLSAAAAAWLDAKREEEAANARRLEIEKTICALVDGKTEGSVKTEVGPYKVKVEFKLSRSLNPEKLAGMDKKIPVAILQRLVEYAPKLNLRELRYIEQNEPAHYKAFADCLMVKPAKTSISIEMK